MPYRNPEDKRRWEREHRQQRNERRRKQRLGTQIAAIIPNPVSDPTVPADPKGAATAIAIIVLSVGLLLLALTLWKARKRKLISNPVPDRKPLKGGPNERSS